MVDIYRDYWSKGERWKNREQRRYYAKLYNRVKKHFKIPVNAKVLDVGGGDGHFVHFLGIKYVCIIDISDSGLMIAKQIGYNVIKSNIETTFPILDNSYDVALCFEVLEHLHFPNMTIGEIFRVLKPGGILYVGQPNMKADGIHHIRRFYKKDLLDIIANNGFTIELMDFVPAFTMRDAIIDDIKKNESNFRKIKQNVALFLSFLPYKLRYIMAKIVPNRFALLFIVKAVKHS